MTEREKNLRNRDDFQAYMALEYLEYARDLANKYNWRDADYFARKGLRSADNRENFPEVPEAWDIDNSKIEETSLARRRLQELTNPKAKQYLPIQLAHLTLLYDCWVSKENQPWQLASLSKCKVRFFRLADEMDEYLAKIKPPENVKEVVIPEPQFNKFDVHFDFNSYKFNESAATVLLSVLSYLEKLNGDYRILLVGSADRSGKKIYNDRLARERVIMTKNKLIKNGVPERLIEIKALGERKSKVITKDQTQNKENRRVSVYVLEGNDSLLEIPLPLIDHHIYRQNILKYKKERGIR
ncbi:MAG: OmpA family protein [Proteobacteria bacterium]|nr:OmpA family protein [Pseudomonadota bacterium]